MSAARGDGRAGGAPPPLGDHDVPALTLAMALAPGVYSRNRFFALFESRPLKRARSRAWVVRSVARDLSRGPCTVAVRGQGELSLEVPTLSFKRTVQLSALELAGLRVLLSKTPHGAALPANAADHAAVTEALASLSRRG